jgi:alkylated DNA repair protein alkB homolog 8
VNCVCLSLKKTFFCLKVYEEIASHFSETRHKPWPNVKNFVESQEPGAVILDVGCGNGKYLGLNSQAFQVSEFVLEENSILQASFFQIGCDMSQQLAEICRQRSFEAFLSNCLYIPFRDCSVDCCISIAVIHHLSTQVSKSPSVLREEL